MTIAQRARVFDAWRIEAVSVARGKLHFRENRCRNALRSWSRFSAASIRLKGQLASASRHRHGSAARLALRALQESVLRRKEAERLWNGAIVHRNQRICHVLLSSWYSLLLERRRSRQLQRQALVFWRRAVCARSVGLLIHFSVQRQRLRTASAQVVLAVKLLRKRAVFRRLSQLVAHRRRLAQVATEHATKKLERVVFRRLAVAVKGSALRSRQEVKIKRIAWRAWWMKHIDVFAGTYRKTVLKRRHLAIWKTRVQYRTVVRASLLLVEKSIRFRLQRAGWADWNRFVRLSSDAERNLKSADDFWKRAISSRTWKRLRAFTASRLRKKRTLLAFDQHRCRVLKARSVLCWKGYLADRSEQRNITADRHRRRSLLSQHCGAWRLRCASRKKEKAFRRAAVGRRRADALRKMFSSWKARAVGRQPWRKRQLFALDWWRNLTMQRALRVWREKIAARKFRQGAMRRAESHYRRRLLVQCVLFRWPLWQSRFRQRREEEWAGMKLRRRFALNHAVKTLWLHRKSRKELKGLAKQAICLRAVLLGKKSLRAWKTAAAESIRLKEAAHWMAVVATRISCRRILLEWKDASRARFLQRQASLGAMQHMQLWRKLFAVVALKQFVVSSKQKLLLAEQLEGHYCRRRARAAVRKLLRFAFKRAELRRLGRMANEKAVRAAVSRWKEHCVERSRSRTRQEQSVTLFQHTGKIRGVQQWLVWCARRLHDRQRVEKVGERALALTFCLQIQSWRKQKVLSFWRDMTTYHWAISRLFRALEKPMLSRWFHRWQEEEEEKEELSSIFSSEVGETALQRALARWRTQPPVETLRPVNKPPLHPVQTAGSVCCDAVSVNDLMSASAAPDSPKLSAGGRRLSFSSVSAAPPVHEHVVAALSSFRERWHLRHENDESVSASPALASAHTMARLWRREGELQLLRVDRSGSVTVHLEE